MKKDTKKPLMNLNLGGGYTRIEGFMNVDNRKATKPEFLTNLENKDCLRAIKKNSVGVVYASHVLEHIKNLETLMKEIYRVLAPNGQLIIRVPYWNHQTAVEDPTHIRFFTERSMMYFSRDTIGSDGYKLDLPYDFVLSSTTFVPEKGYEKLSAEKLLALAHKQSNVIKEISFLIKAKK